MIVETPGGTAIMACPEESPLTVLSPGLLVEFTATDGAIKGKLCAVQIAVNNRVLYLVTWWSGTLRQEAWVEQDEIKPVDPGAGGLRIGFVVPKHVPPRESDRRLP